MTDDSRAVRAVEDVVAVDEYAPGMVRVTTFSDAYFIDASGDGCMCPDKQYNLNPGERCKHEEAAILADYDHLPAPYVQHVEDRPTALADGGDTCEECAALPGDWECWPCAAANDIGLEADL